MNFKITLTCLLLFVLNSCQAQNKNMIMTKKDSTSNLNFERKYDLKTGLEMYNFEIMKNSKTNPAVFKMNNGWTVLVYPMQIGGGYYNEYSPSLEFTMIQKIFYPNGLLKQKSYFFQNNLKIGIWEYYDEKGNLIKKVNEDEKFKKSKVKLKDVLNLLEREGWINLKTGEGATEIISSEAHVEIKQGFNIMFTEDEYNKVTWYANKQVGNGAISVSYEIDGITGKVTKKEVPIIGIE